MPKPAWFRRFLHQIILSTLPARLRFHGCWLAPHPEDPIMGSALLLGHYEEFELKLFAQSVVPGMTVVDLGANIGIYTCCAAQRVGINGSVTAFEPDPTNFACLLKSIQHNGFTQVKAEPFAISDQNGEALLFQARINKGDHRLQPVSSERRSAICVQTQTFDHYWSKRHKGVFLPIDLIKIDVQGAEYIVFIGLKETLRHSPCLKVFLECSPTLLREQGIAPERFLQEWRDLGFKLFSIEQRRRTLVPVLDLNLYCAKSVDHHDLFLER